jgi:class 3 adenylate cyclase
MSSVQATTANEGQGLSDGRFGRSALVLSVARAYHAPAISDRTGLMRRLAAILAADVVGYSRLMAADEQGTHARLKTLRKDFIEPEIAKQHGRVVKLTGDGALVEFPSVVDAVECAAAIQAGVAERQADQLNDRRIVFRIGINIGDVIIEEEDIYGDGVNVAARLEELAEPGGICIARNVYNQVKNKVAFGFEPMGEHRVKNIPEPVIAYHVRRDLGPVAKVIGLKHAGRSKWRWGALAAALVLLLGAGGWWWHERQAAPGQPAGTAGLPLPDSRNAEKRYPAPEEPEITPNRIDATLGRSEWRAIQDALRDLGYYQGVTNGKPSYAVRTAIWEFQLAQGAAGSGYLSVLQMIELHMVARDKHPPTGLPEFDLADVLRRSEAGDPEAQRVRGQLHDTWYQDGGLPKDNFKAARWYRKAAEAGDLEAAKLLSWLLKDGDGVEPDLAEAAHWLEMVAKVGDADALVGLAELYEHGGKGIRQDREKAIRLYRRAADLWDGGFAIAKLRALGAWGPEQSTAAQAER